MPDDRPSSRTPSTVLPPLAAAVGLLAVAGPALAGEARVAVAANFRAVATEIGSAFESACEDSVVFSFGSTGQLYAQIDQGAPFDAFLAADSARVSRTVESGLGVPGTQFTYAVGRIALFSSDRGLVSGPDTLRRGRFARLAIAQPSTAPYGVAAIEALRRLGVYGSVSDRIVTGANVAQAYQFVHSGNADLGLVSLSQIVRHDLGSRWVVPSSLHSPIRQDAVLLARGRGNEAAKAFLKFLREPAAGAILDAYGYSRPE